MASNRGVFYQNLCLKKGITCRLKNEMLKHRSENFICIYTFILKFSIGIHVDCTINIDHKLEISSNTEACPIAHRSIQYLGQCYDDMLQ